MKLPLQLRQNKPSSILILIQICMLPPTIVGAFSARRSAAVCSLFSAGLSLVVHADIAATMAIDAAHFPILPARFAGTRRYPPFMV